MAEILIGNIKGPQGVRGSQWYYGTGITGTSTTAQVFDGSGVTLALVGDYYLSTASTASGNVYRCSKEGDASTAEWVYAGDISGPQGEQGIQGEIGPMPALINNALTTTAGMGALDAAMGKTLSDKIDTLNGKIIFKSVAFFGSTTMTALQSLSYTVSELIDIPAGYTVKMVVPRWSGAQAASVVGRYNGTVVTFTNITSAQAQGISGSADILLMQD